LQVPYVARLTRLRNESLGGSTVPRRLKPTLERAGYRSGEPLRHPKARAKSSFSATCGTRALPDLPTHADESSGQLSYKGVRARLDIMSAVIVPARAGTGRMNTMRTAHINCLLKQGDPCGGWPHSTDTTIQTRNRKCGESSNAVIIRLLGVILCQDRQAA
jgi:hypothetical protein